MLYLHKYKGMLWTHLADAWSCILPLKADIPAVPANTLMPKVISSPLHT